MPDTEQVEVKEAAAPETPGVPVEATPADQEGATPTIPKPRFDEVLNRAKAAEQAAHELRTRVQLLETKAAAPDKPAQQIPTLQQVLTAYDRGQLTEAQKDQWVHYHSKEDAKREFGTVVAYASAAMRAQSTTDEYLRAIPNLGNPSSEEFRTLSSAFNELVSEGAPIDSVVTQAKALRLAFGPIKTTKPHMTDFARQRADTFLEGGGGGGGRMATDNNPLKDVSPRQIDYWKSKGYTKSEMAEEAKLYDVRNLKEFRRATAKKK